MFRREWRQQIQVVALLTVAVAAAVGSSAAAYNMTPISGNAEFGTANHRVRFDAPDPETLRAAVAAAEDWFGTVDVIGHRYVGVPGRFEPVEYRSQDPRGAFGAPMLALVDGRFPTAVDEVAVTAGIAETFDLTIGSRFAVDGTERTIVGTVEDPSDLADDFALISPAGDAAVGSVTILVDGSDERVRAFHPPGVALSETASRSANDDVLAAVGVLGVATVAMLFIALLAATGFVVIAQRRLRRLGMMAAIGATEKHLRSVMIANGLAIGVTAAVAGTLIGVTVWFAVVPRLETSLGFRIDRVAVPWWLIAACMVLAVVTAVGAAWWPARAVARTPIVLALSGRPPRPRPAHRSAVVAGALIVAGVICFAIAGDFVDDRGTAQWTNMLLVVVATMATVGGVLFAGPLAIRTLARLAPRLPVSPRLALRDLVRYQARSGAALAAITLALGIPMATVVAASAAVSSAGAGNLSDHQLLIRAADVDGPYVPFPAALAELQAQIDRIAATLDEPTVTALDVALDPTLEQEQGVPGRLAITLARKVEDGWADLSLLYVAAPSLLEAQGLDLVPAGSDVEVVTGEAGDLRALGVADAAGGQPRDPVTPTVAHASPRYSSLPGTFVTEAALQEQGWQTVPSGRWLVEARSPLTADQLTRVREIAANAGLTVESRDQQAGLKRMRLGATAVGVFLALAILALTVGLIRGEAAADLRSLTAVGAPRRTRRALTAATACALAVLGVLLGTAGALIAMIGGFLSDLSALGQVPLAYVAVILLGTPIAAYAAGWLLAGREPLALGRKEIG